LFAPTTGHCFVEERGPEGELVVRLSPSFVRNCALVHLFMLAIVVAAVFGILFWSSVERTWPLLAMAAVGAAVALWHLRTMLFGNARWVARRGELAFIENRLFGEHHTVETEGTLVYSKYLDRSTFFLEQPDGKHRPWRRLLTASFLNRGGHLRHLVQGLAAETGFPLEERGWGF